MKPRELHQEAMHYSFLAKRSIDSGEDAQAFDYYTKAAEIESSLARFYFDKPEMEPTRSIIVRSAAFLNLKAGLIEEARHFIFWGLLYTQDEKIKEELNQALEFSQVLGNIDIQEIGRNADYWQLLRQRSIHYTIEPAVDKFGSAVSLEMVRDFSEDYLKSLKAYAVAAYKKMASGLKKNIRDIDAAANQFENLINPLVTTTSIGSFKFSIANDFLQRTDEDGDVVRLKKELLKNYHDRIFINPLDDTGIQLIKTQYSDDEINQIFRPITRLKKPGSSYKIAYFDTDTFRKTYLHRIENHQKKKLLPLNQPSKEEIGVLESLITHTKNRGGKKKRSLILKEQLKTYEIDIKTKLIDAKDKRPLPLNEEIIISSVFNADKGFTFTFDDLNVQQTDTDYARGLQGFYSALYDRIIELINADSDNPSIHDQLRTIRELVAMPDILKLKK